LKCRDLIQEEREARKKASGIRQIRGASAFALRKPCEPRIAFSSGGRDLYSEAEVARARKKALRRSTSFPCG
jgi:hypothetical protein